VRAIEFDGDDLRLRTDYPDPVVPPGEALVRVHLAGICNTDLEILKGYMDFRGVPGHEFVGIVEHAEARDWVGKRVVGEINCSCWQCPTCRAGRPTHCPNRTTLGISGRDGAFAERLCLPLRNLHPVPDSVPDEEAVFVEPLAAALEILEQVHIRPTDRVAVIGDGKLGLLVAQVLSLTGAEVHLVGRHPEKMLLLEDRAVLHLEENLGELQVDCVVECSGQPGGLALARTVLRPRGTLVMKSTYHGDVSVNLSALVVDEVTLVGSRCGPFAPALRLLERGLVSVQPLVSAVYPLSRWMEAFAAAQQKGVLKVLLDMRA